MKSIRSCNIKALSGLILLFFSLMWTSGARSEASSTNNTSPFNVEAATRAYLDQLTPAQKIRSDSYFEGGYWLQLWEYLWDVAVALLILQGRWSARLRDWTSRISRFKSIQTALYASCFFLIIAMLDFPLTVYSDFYREHQYGMATQGFGSWFGDQMIALVVNTVFGALFVVVLMAVVRRLKNSWHLWGSVVAICFTVLLIILGPVFFQPLFNKYTLLSDPKILKPILSMAHANGIKTDKVYEMDSSRQTTKVSANVSGILGTMRITLNDNLVNRSSLPEIESVMGHEMGHYVMNHVYKMVVFFSIILFAGFAFLRWMLNKLIRAYGSRWGIADIGDVAVLPLAMLIFSTYMFFMTPVRNTIIRTQEIEADMFGLNAARQPDGFAKAALKLSEYRKMEPGPIEEWIFYDHPSGATRIRTAMQWKSENLGSLEAAP